MIDTVALFLTLICASPRYPAYVIGESLVDDQLTRNCGYVGSFDTPGGPIGISLREPLMRHVASRFGEFVSLTQQPNVSTCLIHAVRNYAEASYATSIASRLTQTHAALSAIVRWDQQIFRGQFHFVKELEETIIANGLDPARWVPIAKDLDTYRSNSIHVQPSWSHHGDSSEFSVWAQGQQLVETLLAVKLGLPLQGCL